MTDHADSDAALAAALQAEEDALALAARRDVLAARDTAAELAGQVEYGRALAAKHLDPAVLAAAAAAAPLAKLRAEAGLEDDSPPNRALLTALLHWYKHDFFSWVDAPPCTRCDAPSTSAVGAEPPSPAEAEVGCGRVELYVCGACSACVRFPRHNDVQTLLKEKRGRCGEWANCFTSIASAAGFPARFIVDAADHVWTEVWCPNEGRWLHTDPCEAAADTPLMYEGGWGKTPTWVFGFGDGGAVDVTRRYTVCSPAQLAARRGDAVPVDTVAATLATATSTLQRGHTPLGGWSTAHARAAADAAALAVKTTDAGPAKDLGGRTAGGEAWIKARGEDGRAAPAAVAADDDDTSTAALPAALPAADFRGALRAAFDALRVRGVPANRAAVVALGEAAKVVKKAEAEGA